MRYTTKDAVLRDTPLAKKLSKEPYGLRIVWTAQQARELCAELMKHPIVAYDTETYARDPDLDTPVNNGLAACITMCWRDAGGKLQAAYVHNINSSKHGLDCQGNIYELAPWFVSAKHAKVAHNAPFDYHIVRNHGINIKNAVIDTMVTDWYVDENRENSHGLKECAYDYFGRVRKDFKQTYGKPVLRKDGQPYADGRLMEIRMEDICEEFGPHLTPVTYFEDWPAYAKTGAMDPDFQTHLFYSVADSYDALCLLELHRLELKGWPWINGKSMWDYYLENTTRITGIIQKIERNGMPLDLPFMREMSEACARDLDSYESKILAWAGCDLNINSGQQLAHLIYEEGPKEIRKTPNAKKVQFTIWGKGIYSPFNRFTETGARSTKAEHIVELVKHYERSGNEEDLEKISGLRELVKYRKFEKQRNTYLVKLPAQARKGRVHGRINQIGTTSGRFSSSNPNLQNITTGDKDVYNIRDCFVALPSELLIVADFSQLEYRLLAHFSQEPKLIKLFHEGWDLHSLTCYNIFDDVKQAVNKQFGTFTIEASQWIAETFPDQRKKSKTLNFEIIYGVGARKLADQLGLYVEEAQEMIDGWFDGYPYVRNFMDRILYNARRDGYVRTLWGRYRHPNMARLMHDCRPGCQYRRVFDGQERKCGIRGEEERTIVNSIIQGSAADFTGRAMIRLDDDVELRMRHVRMIMQVHDEVIFRAPREHAHAQAARIKEIMRRPFNRDLRVPMPVSVGVGPTWASAKV